METQASQNTRERTFRMSTKGVLGDVLVAGTSTLASQLRSSGF